MGDICCDNRFEIIKKAKDELLFSTNIDTAEDEMKVIDSFLFRCWQMGWLEKYDKPREPLDIPTMTTEFVKEHGLPCPNNYEFRDENGNVIQAKKIVLEKKKPEWPKNFKECLGIMNDGETMACLDKCYGYKGPLITKFQELLFYRDTYWRMAGDWKPDYDSGVDKFGIICYDGVVQKSGASSHWERHCNKILDFPTAEMRDAFYENFKDLIEECKELL